MSASTGVIVMDKQTGEVIELDCVDNRQLLQAVRGTAKALDKARLNIGKSRKEQFAMINQDANKKLVTCAKLTSANIKVWMYCCTIASYGGRIRGTQKGIADTLDMGRTTVGRTFLKLTTMKVLAREMNEYGRPDFYIAEEYLIKGKRNLAGTEDMADQVRQDEKGKANER